MWSPSALAVACAWLVLRVMVLTLCSLLLSSGPRCSTPWPVWTRGEAVQRDLAALVAVTAMACAWLVLLVAMLSRCVLFECRQARVACLASWSSWTSLFVARLCNDRYHGPDSAESLEFVQFLDKVMEVPVGVQRLVSSRQCDNSGGSAVAVRRVLRQVPWCRRCTTPLGGAAVAVSRPGRRLPCCGTEANPCGPGVPKTTEMPQLQYIDMVVDVPVLTQRC